MCLLLGRSLLKLFCGWNGREELVEVSWAAPVGTHKEVHIDLVIFELYCMICYPLNVDFSSWNLLQEPSQLTKPFIIAISYHCMCIKI